MEYKDIVVHLGTDNRSAARLDAAIEANLTSLGFGDDRIPE